MMASRRPVAKKKFARKMVCVRLEFALEERLGGHCEETGRTRQWVVKRAIEDYLSRAEQGER